MRRAVGYEAEGVQTGHAAGRDAIWKNLFRWQDCENRVRKPSKSSCRRAAALSIDSPEIEVLILRFPCVLLLYQAESWVERKVTPSGPRYAIFHTSLVPLKGFGHRYHGKLEFNSLTRSGDTCCEKHCFGATVLPSVFLILIVICLPGRFGNRN